MKQFAAMRASLVLGVCALGLGVASTVQASSVVTPTYTDFTALPAANFGGSGIPNDHVAVTTIQDGSATITLGLTAHQRYSNPAPVNDGAGTFYAEPGSDGGNAKWNFGFYANVSGGSLSDYSFDLLYDFDASSGTLEEDHGVFNISSSWANTLGHVTRSSDTIQGSQNLAFGFLEGGMFLWHIDAPSGSFDPNALGEYSFALIASKNGQELGRSAMHVNTTPVPVPLPAAAWAGFALLGALGGVRGLRRKLAKTDTV